MNQGTCPPADVKANTSENALVALHELRRLCASEPLDERRARVALRRRTELVRVLSR